MILRFSILLNILIIGINIFLLCLLLKEKIKSENIKDNTYDFLTKAYSRSSLMRDLKTSNDIYVFFCDLDNFKKINDIFGHTTGDGVLIKSVKAWQSIPSKSNYKLYRNGGDEFVFILQTSDGEEAADFANKIINAIRNQKEIYFSYISVSVGLASNYYATGSKLLSFADNAMYIAKANNKNNYVMFNEKLKKDIDLENKYKNILEDILNNKINFEVYYQPQLNLKTKEIVGAEALLRVRDNDTFLDTQKFINIAERDSKILKLDNIILNKILKDVKNIFTIKKDLIISVNFSGKHISIENFSEDIYDDLSNHNIMPKNFEIEITEESYVRGLKSAISNIDRLKRLGIKIALDDFGSGFSSLKYLSKFKFNVLKIDKSFIDDIESNIKILSLIIDIGHSLNAQIVAEGVETASQLSTLKSLNCDIIQGFYFYKPMPFENFKQLIENTLN